MIRLQLYFHFMVSFQLYFQLKMRWLLYFQSIIQILLFIIFVSFNGFLKCFLFQHSSQLKSSSLKKIRIYWRWFVLVLVESM